jgi:hypothetical protein
MIPILLISVVSVFTRSQVRPIKWKKALDKTSRPAIRMTIESEIQKPFRDITLRVFSEVGASHQTEIVEP